MAVTIPGAKGSTAITFSLTTSAAGNYATDFAKEVASQTSVGTLPNESTVPGALFVYTDAAALNTILTTGSQYFYINNAASNIVTLAASNETVLVGTSTTVLEDGAVGGERVVFTGGSNSFTGSLAGGVGDTITSGTGSDTIVTGGGPSTVFAEGTTSVTLNGNDIAVLQAGNSTVLAIGASDTVFAAASGSIVGGTGNLLITSSGGSVTISGGVGNVTGFLTSGSDFTFNNSVGGSFADFNAGAGNETLDGAGASGGFAFFADTAAGDAGTVVDSVTGGSGYDFFSTGTGLETITAGTGSALFEINSVSGGNITINDFGAADSVNFFGDSVSAEQSFLSTNGTATGGNYVVTLSDSTTVTFTGITSLNGHLS